MKLAKWNPWQWNNPPEGRQLAYPLARLQRDFDQLWEGLFDDNPLKFAGRAGEAYLTPQVDVSETDQEYVVTVEMPGLKEEDIEVEFTGESLRIRGEKRDERDEKQHNFHRVERSFGMFERVIPIPAEVDREQTQATYKNGVLSVTLPKSAVAPSTHKISVKPGT